MTNEHSKDDTSENLFSNKPHEVIEKLGISYYELNNKFINLLEENQKIKQQCKNLEEKNQENVLTRINSELKENLQEKEIQFEKLQQYVSNLKKQRNEEIQQLQRLDMMSQNLEKNLNILKLNEINESIIKDFKENNEDFLSSLLKKENESEKSQFYSNIKVVVGLDFGTTHSGFSYCHVADKQNICSNKVWPGEVDRFKTNTILQYDNKYNNVLFWGAAGFAKKRYRKINKPKMNKPVKSFKLHLDNLKEHLKPKLPVDYKKAITDYLREIGKVIKHTIATQWNINYFENVLLVLTIPPEYSEEVMKRCAYNANLINNQNSEKLQFITESEAAAISCMENGLQFLKIGTTFMVIDCGGDTVDLITHKLIGNSPLRLSKVTEHVREFCGSTFIDNEFINFLRERLSTRAIDLLMEYNYGQFQCLIREFCKNVKETFTGDNREFNYDLDIEDNAPSLFQYINKETREIMEENEFLINIQYNDIKLMFDPIIEKILHLIRMQFNIIQESCLTMLLVGGFCENKYLQNRIKQEFQDIVKFIEVPTQPIAAISRGAVVYGMNNLENESFILSKILKYTYGTKLCMDWKEGVDPPHRRTTEGKIYKFSPFVKKGTEIFFNQVFSVSFLNQTELHRTTEYNAEYCDEPGMILLGMCYIDPPDVHFGCDSCDRLVTLEISFGKMEITAIARNNMTGREFEVSFCLEDY
ncbi:hypothetical protein RclHR1_01870018 [Rhizophagus clarus]|uniref:Hsp70 family protein n=1 Tax=Rhizophagus clarus TaxID=94130 RepID=A0A2Z6QMB7_9GLOM|nr:hypothetical protein RclHR1_01870018 [Rhizophagus clarus]